MNMFTAVFRTLIDIIFPPDATIRIAESATIESISPLISLRPAADLPRSLALFNFDHPIIRRLIHATKYHRHKEVANLFGALLAEQLESTEDLPDTLLLVPVPLHTKKHRLRGYNQASWIAEAAAKHIQMMTCTLDTTSLVRVRDTPSQTKMRSRSARKENMRYAFEVQNLEMIMHKDIILIDDVATTGATAHDARRALKEAGAKSVFIAVVASGAKN